MNDLKDYAPFDKWIAIDDMIVGKTYFCKGRNFTEGVWNGKEKEEIETMVLNVRVLFDLMLDANFAKQSEQ